MPFDLINYDLAQWTMQALPYLALLLLIAYVVLGGVLDFHWRHYGVGIVKLLQLRALYVSIGVVLFGVLFVGLMNL